MATIDGSEVAAVEAIEFGREDKHLTRINADAAAPFGQRPLICIGRAGKDCSPPVDEDKPAVAADEITCTGSNRLYEESAGRQIAASVGEIIEGLRQSDDCQRPCSRTP
jgi:hypothetical protein